MPAKSKAQQRLMAAAEHGADFPMAQQIRQSMSHQQMHDFAVGSMKGKPAHVRKPAAASPKPAPQAGAFGSVSGQYPHRNLGGYLHPPKKGR